MDQLIEWLPIIGGLSLGLTAGLLPLWNTNKPEPRDTRTGWAVPGVVPAMVSPGEYMIPIDGKDVGLRAKIPADIRAEIDQTPEWWDKQFHRLMVESNQPYDFYGEIEYIEERSFAGPTTWIMLPRQLAYHGCVCQECFHVRTLGVDPRD